MNSWPRSSCVCRFDENDRITWALRSSVLDAIACILHLIFSLRAQTFLDTRYPGRYRHPPFLSLSLFSFFFSFVNCEIQNLRTSYLGTWPPSFYETFDKRLRAKFPSSFVTRLLQHSDFRPLVLACPRFSYATLPQSSSNLHCSSGWIRFDVLLLRRNIYVIDCMIETKFLGVLY